MKRKSSTFKSLRALETAARSGSIADAAIELDVTRPAISQQVRNLEGQMAATLFLRDSTGVGPDAGWRGISSKIESEL